MALSASSPSALMVTVEPLKCQELAIAAYSWLNCFFFMSDLNGAAELAGRINKPGSRPPVQTFPVLHGDGQFVHWIVFLSIKSLCLVVNCKTIAGTWVGQATDSS